MLQIKKTIQQNLTSVSTSVVQYDVLGVTDTAQIKQLYDSYKSEINNPDSVFQAEFLYIPSEKEIANTIATPTSCYIGARHNGQLVAVLKLQNLGITPENKTTPFFVPPRNETLTEGAFFGISGMLTSRTCRGKGLVLPMITQTLKALQANGAAGVYADCDYRNISSFNALSSFLNFIGFTDGRNGLPGEKTIYITFYNSFNTMQPTANKSLTVSEKTPVEAYTALRSFMSQLGQGAYTSSKVPLANGCFNQVYVLTKDRKIKLQKITDMEKSRWTVGTCIKRREEQTVPFPANERTYDC